MLWKRFSNSESDNFVSWILDKQEAVVKSSRQDKEALRMQLVPEKFREGAEKFNSIIQGLDADFRRFEAVLGHYRRENPSLPVDKVFNELESLEPGNIQQRENEIMLEDYDIEETAEYFRNLMREEVKKTRNIGEDLIQIENNLEQLEEVDPRNVQRAKKQIEKMDNPELREGDNVNDLIWDILLVKKEIHQSNEQIHDIAMKYR
jgi:hypothetical protein